ncbi:hypothetical protein ABGN05_14115 [Aquibium sp. LZ166]|uniref:Uncharacterized protein n=1 Tax=Aquibium pacificus TaxID=3153579 RepID=A0ABV3SJ53_9HYPH
MSGIRMALSLVPAFSAGLVLPVFGQDTQAIIGDALSAAPPQIAANAKVMTMEGETLKEGDGAYTCFPGVEGGPGPMCLDSEWMRWADAWMNKKDSFQPNGVGLAYMLAGDMPGGGASNIDPFAMEATPDNEWVTEGPHLMVILPDPAALEAIPTDPDAGVPYVMWKGTPYAHIMVPVAERPQ